MKKYLISLLFLFNILIFTGCTTYELEPRWAPLKAVIQTNDLPFYSDTTTTTVSPYVYTEDLDKWLEKNPPGSVPFEALMHHEHTHALRQEAYPGGKTAWLYKYLMDRNFRLEEEKAGYREEILHYLRNGYRIVPESYAASLSSNVYHGMISYEEALEWVRSVMTGR